MRNDDLLEKDVTSKEVKSLVEEFLENGGKITHCVPGVALNFRATLLKEDDKSKNKKLVRRIKNKRSKK